MKLNNFFRPKAVAIVGASTDKAKIGRQILDNISASFSGRIYPINLNAKKIAGRRASPDLKAIPATDRKQLLVVIAIPAAYVLAEVEKCGQLGIRDIIIISAGFKEEGAEGRLKEEGLSRLASEYKLNILGPNCLGFINNVSALNASFAETTAKSGRVALLSQSGAIGSAALDWLGGRGFDLAYFISLGNKAVLDESDFLEYLADDKNVEAIFCYLEDIKDGKRFMMLASRLAPKKPIFVLKAGLSERGQKMARSHTGALASASAAVSAGLERSGVTMLSSSEELFLLLAFYCSKAPKNWHSGAIKIITNAGGLAVLSADAADRQQITLKESIDVLGDALPERYEEALRRILKEKTEEAVLILLTPQSATRPLEIAQVVTNLAAKYPKRLIITSFLGGIKVAEAKNFLHSQGLPVLPYPEEAIKLLSQLTKRRQLLANSRPFKLAHEKNDRKKVLNRDYLELFQLLRRYKIPVVKTEKLSSSLSLKARAGSQKSQEFPVVLKIVGDDFNHKSDQGGIVLGLSDRGALTKAATAMSRRHAQALKKDNNYLVIQPQVEGGLELIVGLKRDAVFGPLLLVGLGGIYAEIFKQVRVVIADLDQNGAEKFIKKLPFFPLLAGARGRQAYDIKKLAKVLVALSQLAAEHPEITELDINPLFITTNGVLAADVRAF